MITKAMVKGISGKKGQNRVRYAIGDHVSECVVEKVILSVGRKPDFSGLNIDKVGRFPFRGNGKALILNETKGMVKVNSDKAYGDIIGSHATDMISEAVLGMTMEMTMEELAHAIHPYPTVSAAIMEAALTLAGGIHMPQTPEIGWTA